MTTSRVFHASRLTRENRLFPASVEITEQAVVRRKRSWLSEEETSIHLAQVASVGIQSGIVFAELHIESSGGGEDIVVSGLTKGTARRIRALIQEWQSLHLGQALP